MRVAFISSILHYPWGGADSLWTSAAEAASRGGHTLFLGLSPQTAAHSRIRRLADQGAVLHLRREHADSGGRRTRLRRWLATLSTRPALLAALEAFRPDVVCLCQGGTYDFLMEPALMEWLRTQRVPHCFLCQANAETTRLSLANQGLARSTIESATSVVFVSSHNLKLAESQLGQALPHARLVQNPTPHSGLGALPWPAPPPWRMATVSRIECRDKGLDLLLSALAQSLGPEPGWEVDLFGTGPDESLLRTLASRHGLDDRVRLRGHCADVRGIWSGHHLMLLPSRIEGCSLAMMEALLCGRPVLATPVGGVGDWISDGTDGFVCPDFSEESLKDTLRRAWAARAQWADMGLRAAASAAGRIDPDPGRALLRILGNSTGNPHLTSP